MLQYALLLRLAVIQIRLTPKPAAMCKEAYSNVL
jgi:hypothetical protein